MVAKLRTFSGIGPITAATMRARDRTIRAFSEWQAVGAILRAEPAKMPPGGQRQADAGLVRAGNRQLRAGPDRGGPSITAL